MPDLTVTAAFDQEQYQGGDLIRATVTIANAGLADAHHVRAVSGGNVNFGDTWGDVDERRPGITIEAGSTRAVALSGHIFSAPDREVFFGGTIVLDEADANPDDNRFSARASVVETTGTFGGTIFTDHNANGSADAGEGGLSGVSIKISGGLPSGEFERTTDAQGRFSFADIPTGHYTINYSAPPAWVVFGLTGQITDSVLIDDSGNHADVRLPAVRHLWDALTAKVTFGRASYQPDDTTELTVVLSNRSDHTVTGVRVECANFTFGPYLRCEEGWGPLARGGPGVTVPARTTTVITVTEPVPAASPRFGFVSVSANVTAAGFPKSTSVFVEATARVPGATASGQGRIFHDLNSNGSLDDGEALDGVTVAITDPDTGAAIARPVTGDGGLFTVNDVPASVYDLRVVGPWKPTFGSEWFRFPVMVDPFGVPHYGVVPGPAQENNKPNLKVSASLDKSAYNSGDDVRARITVTNIGEVAATAVRAQQDFDGPALRVVSSASWGELYQFGPGARIETGETRVFEVVGFIGDPDAGSVTFGALVHAESGDINFQNNRFALVAGVTRTTGNYGGVVYGDANNNGVLDSGEELAGVRVNLSGRVPGSQLEQDTDSKGRFAFLGIPTGRYNIFFRAPDGWITEFVQDFLIDEVDDPQLIRAVRPLSETVQASIEFQKDAYDVGEIARLTVTVTNNGTDDLTGVKVFCARGGSHLQGDEGWEPLANSGPGMPLGAGETRTVEVFEAVPELSGRFGYVEVGCDFLAAGHPLDGSPVAGDRAKVPGGVGMLRARLLSDSDGDGRFDEGIAGTKVVLMDTFTGQPVAKTVTDDDGRFVFADIEAGLFELRVVGPWKSIFGGPTFVNVFAGDEGEEFDLWMVPGPEQPDPFPHTPGGPGTTPTTPASPAPQGSTAPAGLASTGADVVGLVAVSLGLIGAGFGAAVAARRRKPAN